MKQAYCAFDIGGTNTRMAISRDGLTIDKILTAPTQRNYQRGMRVVNRLYKALFGNDRAKLAAGGIAGTFNKDKTKTLDCPQLPGWVGKPMRLDLTKLFHCPVILENDVALGGLGEAVVGAGKRANIVGYYSVGTEVGGSRIVEGRVDRVAFGFEPGKQLFNRHGRWQTLEEIIGGRGIQRYYRSKPEDIDDQKVWRELREYLALGLRNAIALWSPDVMILGGSVMKKLWPVTINKRFSSGLIWPMIKRGRLGDHATLIGALVHLKKYGHLVG
ncbi:MAG: ROK family protein [Patescibacteria group bacterium]|jgi:predicted NBD/HSP70 family sugar kinase